MYADALQVPLVALRIGSYGIYHKLVGTRGVLNAISKRIQGRQQDDVPLPATSALSQGRIP